MYSCETLWKTLKAGQADQALARLYAPDGSAASLDAARDRALRVVEGFRDKFGANSAPAALFSGPGRTEIGGNHTDHQHGRVLCGSIDLDVLGCAAPNGGSAVRIFSREHPPVELSLDDLRPREEERSTSQALVRGVAARLTELGCTVSGFDAYTTSNVPTGAGLSSSAAFEVLLGNIFNHFFCHGALNPVTIAKVGQYAENVYFGKPCGLMDQMGASVGGAVAIDFADPDDPVVKRVGYDFSLSGHALCIVDTGSCHADLTGDYADIPREMGAVAEYFHKRVLREVPEEDFWAEIAALKERCGDRAVLRAIHFYEDDRRAAAEARALRGDVFGRFLELVNASGVSSETLLQNIWVPGAPREQALSLALAVGKRLLRGRGAIRVHGGGFAGTIQAFVPSDRLSEFRSGMEAVFGEGKCHVLHIRPQGGCVVLA